VLQQSIGFDGSNRPLMYDMFDSWKEGLKRDMPDVTDAEWATFRGNMYDGDFDFNVGRDFVATCQVPMLVLMGNDAYHPMQTSREIAEIAPKATLIEDWKSEPDNTARSVIAFLQRHP
jgi:hypothetical protein